MRLQKIWSDLDPCSIQLVLSTILTLWGLWVLWPTTNVFDSSLGFRAMQTMATETEWGGGVALLGFAGLWALETNASGARVTISFVAGAVLLFMAFLFAISSITSTGWIVWGVFSVFQWSVWARFRHGGGCANEPSSP